MMSCYYDQQPEMSTIQFKYYINIIIKLKILLIEDICHTQNLLFKKLTKKFTLAAVRQRYKKFQ